MGHLGRRELLVVGSTRGRVYEAAADALDEGLLGLGSGVCEVRVRGL